MIRGPQGSHITIMYSPSWKRSDKAEKILRAFEGRTFTFRDAVREDGSIYFHSSILSAFRTALTACGEIDLSHERGEMDRFHCKTDIDARILRNARFTIRLHGRRPWR